MSKQLVSTSLDAFLAKLLTNVKLLEFAGGTVAVNSGIVIVGFAKPLQTASHIGDVFFADCFIVVNFILFIDTSKKASLWTSG